MKQKVLVTGASGYLGGHIAEHLADAGYPTIAHLRKVPGVKEWQDKMAGILIGDIRNEGTIKDILEVDADVVVYTVSLNHVRSEEDIDSTIETNVTPVWKLLSLAGKDHFSKFIYLSTQQVYGQLPFEQVSEEYAARPTNIYGLTHLMCENICQLFGCRHGIKTISLRLSNGFGPPRFQGCDCWWLVVNDFCKMAIEKGEIRLLSDGSPQRDFIHIRDICCSVEILLNIPAENIPYDVFNVGGGKTHTMIELAHIVAKCYKRKFSAEVPVFLGDGRRDFNDTVETGISRMSYNTERLRSLEFVPQTTIEDGINEVLDFVNSNKMLSS